MVTNHAVYTETEAFLLVTAGAAGAGGAPDKVPAGHAQAAAVAL